MAFDPDFDFNAEVILSYTEVLGVDVDSAFGRFTTLDLGLTGSQCISIPRRIEPYWQARVALKVREGPSAGL